MFQRLGIIISRGVIIVALVLAAALPLPALAGTDEVKTLVDTATANRTAFIAAPNCYEADITIWSPSGTSNATVTVFTTLPNGNGAVQVAQYTSVGAAKTYQGGPNAGIFVTVAISSGDVSVVAVLKR